MNTLSSTGASQSDITMAFGKSLVLGYSAMGMILGYGLSKFSSSVAQFVCELLLSPVTKSAASALPMESFSAALYGASRRNEGTSFVSSNSSSNNNNNSRSLSQAKDAAGGVDEGISGHARRALDRGLRASNQFLYRSVFNLLPSLIETSVVLVIIFSKVGKTVGITAARGCFVCICNNDYYEQKTAYSKRSIEEEGLANGYVEDALNLAETVAAFGATNLEEDRYNVALENVGNAARRFDFHTPY